MIAVENSIEGTKVTGELQTKRLTINSEGISHIANILQDTLYTDKVLAPVREYSTNAMDAHIEAGKPNLPIVVKLPNRFNPVFAVRDFGMGMDNNRIWQVFCNYGSSTKRNTNDQVGMLGIGSKSAFAYPECKAFTIVSIRNGVKKSFVCHKGGCAEGELVQLSEEVTNDKDGLEIQIPVSVNDIQSFIDRSVKFFAHWEVMPTFEGAQINIVKHKRLFEGDDWYMVENDGGHNYSRDKFKIVMGNIAYSVSDISTMKAKEHGISDEDGYVYQKLMDSGLVIKTPIGSVDIAANREGLQMTDKTIKTIWSLLKKVRLEIGKELQKKFDILPTMWEKRVLRSKFSHYGSQFISFDSFLPSHIANIKTEFPVRDVNSSTDGFEVKTFDRSRRGHRRVRKNPYNTYSIHADENTCVIINYVGDNTDTKVVNRIVGLIERNDNVFKKSFKTVHVLNVSDVSKFNLWKVKHEFDFPLEVKLSSLPIYKLSDIYPSARTPAIRSANLDKNSKKFLLLDWKYEGYHGSSFFKEGFVAKKSVNRIPYIVIDRYEIFDGCGNLNTKNTVSFLKTLEKDFQIKLPDVLVAVKKSTAIKLKDNKNYISLWEHLALQLKDNQKFINQLVSIHIRSEIVSDGLSNYMKFKVCDDAVPNWIFSVFNGKFDVFNKTKLFHKILVDHQSVMNVLKLNKTVIEGTDFRIITLIRKSIETMDNKVTVLSEGISGNFIKLLKSFYKTYPMLQFTEKSYYGVIPQATINRVKDYINLVDSSVKS